MSYLELVKKAEAASANEAKKAPVDEQPPALVTNTNTARAEEREAVPRVEEERWDEEEAYMLIRRALAYLCERHLEAGKPDFDAAVLDPYEDAIDETYGAEDMGALRRAVRAFVVAGLREFRRERRADAPADYADPNVKARE